jgi:phage-related tail protein
MSLRGLHSKPSQLFKKAAKNINRGLKTVSHATEKVGRVVEKAAGKVENVANKIASVADNPLVLAGVAAVAPEFLPEVAGVGLLAHDSKSGARTIKKTGQDIQNVGKSVHPDALEQSARNSIQRAKPADPNSQDGLNFYH